MHTSTRRRAVVALVSVAIIAGGLAASALASSAADALDTLDGRLMVAHSDDFHGHNMRMSVSVRTKHGVVRLQTRATQNQQMMALSGKQVHVRGHHVAAGFNASAVSLATAAASYPTTGSKKIAVVLMHLPGSTDEPFTRAQIQANFFGANSSVANWFGDVSNGATTVTGDVYGWYNSTVDTSNCDDKHYTPMFQNFQNQAAAAAAKDGYVAANYQHIVVVTPDVTACGFAGIAWVNANGVWLNNTIFPGVAEHELGHNLALQHAGSLACGSVALGNNCQRDDYGDPFDVMGHAGDNHLYNGMHRYQLGYMPSNEVQTLTGGTTTVTLTSSEVPLSGATELIDVRGSGMRYAIEKRSAHGPYDSSLSGVWIRQVGTSTSNTDDTTLLDMTPATSTFTDGNLAAGQSFTDSGANVTITVNSESATTASVTVGVGGTTSTTTSATTTTTKATTTTTKATTTTTTTKPTTTTTTTPTTPGAVTASTDGTTVTVTGSAGNDTLHIWKSSSGRLSIDASGAPFVVGTNCTVAANVATCKGRQFTVSAGDGNDRITESGGVKSVQDGGAGNDWMIGGTSADVFIGGTGFDTVDYSTRTGTITGTPGTGADDGRAREHDDIRADVEQVIFPAARVR